MAPSTQMELRSNSGSLLHLGNKVVHTAYIGRGLDVNRRRPLTYVFGSPTVLISAMFTHSRIISRRTVVITGRILRTYIWKSLHVALL